MAESDHSVAAAGPAPVPLRTRWTARRIVRIVGRVVAAILLVLFALWLILYITKGRFLKGPFERTASSWIQREVKVAGDFQLYFNLIDIKLYAEGLTVANPAWREGLLFKSDRLNTRIATFPLLFGTRRLKWLDLTGGTLDLAWDPARVRNTFTFGDPNKPAEPFELPDIRTASILGTKIAYLDPLLQLQTDIKVETIRAANTRLSNDIRFTGTGTIRARPFTMSGSLLSPNETLGGGENRLKLAARSGSTLLDVSGTLPGATVIEGAKLKLLARGPNIAFLLEFLGVAIPDTRTYRVTSDLTKTGGAWKFTRIVGRFGASDIGGAMTITLPKNRLNIAADLRTRVLDIIDAGPFIGYDPNALAAGKVTETVGGIPRLIPDGPLDAEALKRFDAQVDYRVARVRAPSLPISDIALKLDLARSRMTLSPLTMLVAGGRLASDITVDMRQRLVRTTYDVRLAPTPMGRLLGGFGVEESGTTGTVKARVQMTGEGNSVRQSLATSDGRIVVILPRGSFWVRNVQLSELDAGTFLQKMFEGKLKEPVQINCGLIGFTVRNGIAAADPILIDTSKNVMVARGGFSFRNESIDLAYRADSKKFSVFAGQSPIALNGYFARPGFSVISPELLGRAGAGLGLALVASPLAGVLAFVDIGDAQSAQCGPVLAGATARGQRTSEGKPRDDVGRGTKSKGEDGKPRKKFLGIF